MRRWQHDACKPELVQHGAHDRLTAIRGPRRLAPDPEAIPPGHETKAPEPEKSLKFGRMFEFEVCVDELDRFGQSRGAKAEGALDDASLAADVIGVLKADAWPLRRARITSKPLIVA
jgi:hypothetical protein